MPLASIGLPSISMTASSSVQMPATFEDEFFGSPSKIALMKRSRNLWSLLKDDPRFAFYGRAVALAAPGPDTAAILGALARVQGATICYYYPSDGAAKLFADLEARGFITDRHEHLRGDETAYRASQTIVNSTSLPDDLTVAAIEPGTSRETVADLAELCLSCEVLPVPGSTMRGRLKPGICLVATDRNGRVVATASSYMHQHASSPRAKDVFWGMLATRPDRRGERIGQLLGAKAIVHMWEQCGARGFITGVRAGNRSSESLCKRLGVHRTDWIYASCIDAELLGEKSITK